MIEKILIAEDHEIENLAIQKLAEELKILEVDHAFYCDEALKKIEIACSRGAPYDLLITDLYFESDGSQQKITNGIDLISAARQIQPDLQILVFSAEKGVHIINKLVKDYQVDAYVRKARNDAKELKKAFQSLRQRQPYLPYYVARELMRPNIYEFSDFDIQIVRLLSQGYQQNQIPSYLKENNISPSSLSSVEKRLNQIREQLGCAKNEQVVLACRNMGIL